MKTICFVVPNFPTVSETFVTNQIVEMKLRGYKVLVLTSKLKQLKHSSQTTLLIDHDILKDVMVVDYGIPISSIKRLVKGFVPILKYFNYWIAARDLSLRYRFVNLPYLLNFYAKLRHVDVFHIQFASGGRGIVEMIDNGLLKAKVIATFHGHEAHYSDHKIMLKLQKRYKVLFEISDYVTVNTSYLMDKIVALGCQPEKIEIIPMGIDVGYFNPTNTKHVSSTGVIKLISIGRLIELKGFRLAIDAVKILIDKGYNVSYTIIGEGQLYISLNQHIQFLGLEENVRLVGNKNQEEIRQLLEAHHIYLMSSITDLKGRAEAQGVVTAEAQAMGLPVIAFDSGGVATTVMHGESGFLVSGENIEAYAEAIVELIEQPDRYQKMSKDARMFVSKTFSKEIMVEHFIALYEN